MWPSSKLTELQDFGMLAISHTSRTLPALVSAEVALAGKSVQHEHVCSITVLEYGWCVLPSPGLDPQCGVQI